MADIYLDFPIKSSPERVFEAISSPEGVSVWWSLSTKGIPDIGSIYELNFGPGYLWTAKVVACRAPSVFEWQLLEADEDWVGTKV